MKKLMFGLAIVSSSLFFAQQTQPKPTPEQRAEKRAEMHQNMEQKQKEHLDKMQKELNLSNAQVQQIQSLQAKNKAEKEAEMLKNKELRAQKREQIKAKKQQRDAEMQKILSPEQYKKWQQNRIENMQHRMDRMKKQHGKDGNMKRNKTMKPSSKNE